MRKLISIVEYGLSPRHSTKEWRDQMLAAFREPESMMTQLSPETTGLPFTVYASETPDLPAIVIDTRLGRNFEPDDNAIVLKFGESSNNQEIDEWLSLNLKALKDYSDAKIGTTGFLKRLKKVNSHLDEMANFRRGEHNLPVTIWIRTEANPLPHNARIKCNAIYNPAPSKNNFSIRLEPDVKIVDGQNTGDISERDKNGLINWITKNKNVFLDFYYGKITAIQFQNYIEKNPYP